MYEEKAKLAFYKKSACLHIQLMPVEKDTKGFPKIGGFMMSFARAAHEGSTKYDWDNAVHFMLAAHEVPKLARMLHSENGPKLYHDPDKGGKNEGTRAKSLYAGHENGKVFLNIASGENRVSIIVEPEEIELMTTLMTSTLKECYGW